MTRTRFWVAAVYCLEPPQIPNGGFRLSTNSTLAGTVVDYYCLSLRFKLSGPSRLVCQPDGHYDRDPPVCTGAHQRFALSLSERRPRNPDRNEKKTKKNKNDFRRDLDTRRRYCAAKEKKGQTDRVPQLWG